MLEPLLPMLLKKTIVLASESPRRVEILKKVGLKFKAVPSKFEENLDKAAFKHPYEYAKATAKGKALDVFKSYSENTENCDEIPDVIIAADTVVTLDDTIYGKPEDDKDAFEMLTRFSGRTQTVYTGVCIIYNQADNCSTDNKGADQIKTFHDATDVTFSTMTSDVIQGYIDTGEPMGKAGGYGIQGIGGSLVESIHGDYYNVMGFPLNHFCRHLQEHLQNQTIA